MTSYLRTDKRVYCRSKSLQMWWDWILQIKEIWGQW
jgi:hypothetical protein